MEFSLVNLLLVLLVAWIAGQAAIRVGYPSILGELAAGIIFGPALLGLIHPSEGLAVLAEVGVFLMMLYIGMEVEYRELARASWGGLLAAIGGFSVPLLLGYGVMRHFDFPVTSAMFMGLAMGVTSLATKSRILVDLNLLGTRIASVLFAAALICDTVALVFFALLMGLIREGSVQFVPMLIVMGKAVLFFGITISFGLRVFPWIGKMLRKAGFMERTANFTLVVAIGLIFAELAELSGLHAILGAFLAGMFIRGEVLMRKISHEVTTLVRNVSLGFLTPIFFVSAGFHVSFEVFRTDLPLLLTVIGLAAAGKILGTTFFYSLSGRNWREGLTIGCGMNGHGAVEIIIAGIALERGLINETVFSILIFMAFATTSSVPVFMKWGVDWLRRRGELDRADEQRRGILILGASPLARLLAKQLDGGEPVTLIDSNTRRCEAAERDGLHIMHGNALREDTMDLMNATSMRMLIAMTSNPEVNTVAAAQARQIYGIPKTLVIRVSADGSPGTDVKVVNEEYPALFGGHFDLRLWSSWILHRETQTTRFSVNEETVATDYLAGLREKDEVLPLVIERGDQRMVAGDVEMLTQGDRVVALRHVGTVDPMADRFDRLVLGAPILDIPSSMSANDFFAAASESLAARLQMDAEEICSMLIARERDSSTVIVPGLAIPHIMVQGEGKSELTIARAREGVSFWGPDAEARILFVIAGTRDERNFHLRVLSAIAQLFQDASFEDRWMAAETAENLRQVILTTERRRF